MYTTERLSDLDELVLRCRTVQSRDYIAEAVSCYRAGAYRACIVNVWIAIVYDLIDKIRELSISGDPAAKAIIDEFERHQKQIDEGNDQAIKSALEFERNILNTAKEKMQFFDLQQYIDLTRLREDRHRCAHPSFHRIEDPYKPSAEQARMHLRNAILHVLSQQPVQGKAAIDQVISLVSSKYFPKDTDKAKIQLESSELSNPRPSLVKGVVDSLLFGFFNDDSPLKFNGNTISALKASLLLHRDLVEERIRVQINKIFRDVPDDKLIGAIFIALKIPEAWYSLEQASKDKVTTFIRVAPADEAVPMLRYSISKPELNAVSKERILTLNESELSEGVLKYEFGENAVRRAIQLYTGVRSWDAANSIADKIILPLMKYFTKADIEEIIKSPRETGADLLGSHGFNLFLEELKNQEYITKDEVNELLDKYDLSRYRIQDA